jgi:hypothetical protein
MPILANVGIPMIFIQLPLMLYALVPVIILEALLIRRWLTLSLRDAFVGVTKANIFSTLIGVPLAWLAMLALEFSVMLPLGLAADKWGWKFDGPAWQVLGFLLSVAWLGPAPAYLHWLVPAAVAILLVPCFFLSVVLERRSCTRTWSTVDPARVRRSVFAANLASYGLLFVLACGWMTYGLVTKGSHVDFRAEPTSPANGGQAIRVETNQNSSVDESGR